MNQRLFLAGCLLCFFLLIPAVAANSPLLAFTLNDQGDQVAFAYQVSRGDASSSTNCIQFAVYQNNNVVAEEVHAGGDQCNAEGTLYFSPISDTDAFYAVLDFYDPATTLYGTYTTPTKTLDASTTDERAPIATSLAFVRNNNPVEYITLGVPFTVDLRLDIQEANLDTLVANLSGLVTADPLRQQTVQAVEVQPSSCSQAGSVYTCTLHNQPLHLNEPTATLTLTMKDAVGNTNTQTLTKTFTVSQDRPEVTFFGTDRCTQDNQCFVRNGNNRILLQLTGSAAGFDNRHLFYSVGGEPGRVSSCSNTECSGNLRLDCTEGPLQIYLTSSGTTPSQDDAGNLLGGKTRETLYCDNTPPVIRQSSYATPSGLDIIKFGDKVTFTLRVTDTYQPTATFNFSAFGEEPKKVFCTSGETPTSWSCTTTITMPPKDDAYTATVTVVVEDVVGNTATAVHVLNVTAVNLEEVPNLWTVASTQYSPEVFNKKFIAQADNNIYYHLRLQPRRTQAHIVRIEPAGCVPEEGFGRAGLVKGSGKDVLVTKQYDAREVLLNLRLRKSRSDYTSFDSLRYTCHMNVWSQWGDVYYSRPEQVNYTLFVKLLETDDVGDNIQKEIKNSQDRVEHSRKNLEELRKYVNAMQPICYSLPFLAGTSATLDATANTLEPIPGAQGAAEDVSQVATKIDEVHGTAKREPFYLQACRFINCDSSINKFIPSVLGDLPGVDTMTQVAGYNNMSYEDIADPYKSIYLAYMSVCLPAVIELTDRHNAVECEYQRCLSDDVRAGFPISECQSARSYAECKYYTGEAFEVIPYTALQRRLGEKVKNILSNPAAMVGMGLSYLFCDKVHGVIPHAACSIPENIKEIRSYIEMYKRWPSFGNSQAYNYCENVMGKIDEDGYWIPAKLETSPFRTERIYTPNGRTVTCHEVTGCRFADNPDLVVRPRGSGMYDVFENGEFRETLYEDAVLGDECAEECALRDVARQFDVDRTEDYLGYMNQYHTANLNRFNDAFDRLEEERVDLQTLEMDQRAIQYEQRNLEQAAEQVGEDYLDINPETGEITVTDAGQQRTLIEAQLDVLRERENKLNEEIEEKQKEVTEAVEEYEKEAKRLMQDQAFEEYNQKMEGGWQKWSRILDAGSAVNYITQYIPGYGDWLQDWYMSNWLNNFFEQDVIQVAFGDYEGYFCENKVETSGQQGQALLTTGRLYRPATHVEGERSPWIDPDGPGSQQGHWTYFVSAGVNAKQGGLRFQIWAYGDQSRNLTPIIELPAENPTYPFERGLLTFNASTHFDTVCIVFEQSGGALFDYFDTVEFDHNRVCNTIRQQ